jgi:tight adherence protein B
MIDSQFAAFALAALAAGCVAYVFLYPILSGERRAEKRQQALVAPSTDRRERIASVSRKDQVAQSLKELEARQKAQNRLTLETRLAQAGLAWSRRTYILVSLVAAGLLGAATLVLSQNPFAAAGAAFVGGFGLPRWYLIQRRKKRIRLFTLELPNAVDVIVRGIRSGLPLNDCLRVVANESREPLRAEFRQVIEAQTLGITTADALQKIYERVPVSEANFFAIVVAIQQKSGGNLSEALSNLSRALRERRKMGDKIKAMSMEAKASAAIIACLPFTVAGLTYLSSPDYISLMWTTQTGKLAAIGGLLWMGIGIAAMKKMISFKV